MSSETTPEGDPASPCEPDLGSDPDSAGTDFARLSWHDNLIYGLGLRVGDPARGSWHSELVLDIDHIVAWLCAEGRRPRFLVAPATLVFHDVTDLRLDVDCGDSGYQVALNELSIDRIERAPVAEQKICLDRPYYAWTIALNLPPGGRIAFGASGFTQRLRARPVECDEQRLPAETRP